MDPAVFTLGVLALDLRAAAQHKALWGGFTR